MQLKQKERLDVHRRCSVGASIGLKTLLFSVLFAFSGLATAERDSSRDQYRHPVETLKFFGIMPEMDVLEISPGGGWYTEVLAQYLKGDLLAAHYDPSSERSYYRNSQNRFAAANLFWEFR